MVTYSELLDEFDLSHEVGVITNGLARDAGMCCEVGFVERTIWRKIKQRVDENWDRIVLREGGSSSQHANFPRY